LSQEHGKTSGQRRLTVASLHFSFLAFLIGPADKRLVAFASWNEMRTNKENVKMWQMRRRDFDAELNRQRERDWELNRALRALRNALIFLLISFAVLALAFVRAWTM